MRCVSVCGRRNIYEMIRGKERGEDRKKEQDRDTDWSYVSAKVKSNVRFGSSGHFKFVSLAAWNGLLSVRLPPSECLSACLSLGLLLWPGSQRATPSICLMLCIIFHNLRGRLCICLAFALATDWLPYSCHGTHRHIHTHSGTQNQHLMYRKQRHAHTHC